MTPFGVPASPIPSRVIERGNRTVLYVGRLSSRKGFDLFMEATDLLLGRREDVTVVVAGHDIHDAAAGSSWQRHGEPVAPRHPGRLRWLGEVDDATLEGLYAAGDVCAVPSRYESFGLVYAEAISRGLPVVAWDVPVAREVCGSAAVLAQPWSPDAFATAITICLAPGGRPDQKALRQVASRYAMDTYLRATERSTEV